MKRIYFTAVSLLLGVGLLGISLQGAGRPAEAQSRRIYDPYPDLDKKIVPIISVGSNLSVGAAQVAGAERDVNKVKAVAQIETDYKDKARIKILVPIQTEKVIQKIDRVPGVSVIAVADYTF